jgi:hypothetical protein
MADNISLNSNLKMGYKKKEEKSMHVRLGNIQIFYK